MTALAPPPVRTPRRARRGIPAPELLAARGLPPDGAAMTEEEYALLAPEYRAELVRGRLEYLPMNADVHQAIQMFLIAALLDHHRARGWDSALRAAGTGVRVPGHVRGPDVSFLIDRNDPRRTAMAWDGADLVVEVVSPDDPLRDTRDKRVDYAAAGIPEYWIVDPRPHARTISVLTLDDGVYAERVSREGDTALSELLPGLTVDVASCFAAR